MQMIQLCRCLAFVLMAGLSTGCSLTDVFKYQNGVARSLADETYSAEARNDQKILTPLYQAETELNSHCRSVKTAGNNKFWKKKVELGLFLMALFTIDECEAKAREIKGYLKQLNTKEKGATARARN